MSSIYPAQSFESGRMSTVPTEASVGASTATTWGLNTAPTETSSFFSKSDDGQSSDLTSGNRDAASTVVGHPELEARKRGGRGGSGGKGGKGGKGGNSGQISLSTTQLGGRWTGNFYPKHTTLPVGLGTDVHEEDGVLAVRILTYTTRSRASLQTPRSS